MKITSLVIAVLALILVVPADSVSADDVVADPGGILSPTSGIFSNRDNGVVWVDTTTGYLVYMTDNDTNDAELNYTKTLDGGDTWETPVTIVPDTGEFQPVSGFGIWYDKWTQGNSGTKIHIAYNQNSGGLFYISLDVSSDSLSSASNVASYASLVGAYESEGVSIVKTESDYIYINGAVGTSFSDHRRVVVSTDDGNSWSSVSQGTFGDAIPTKLAPAIQNETFLVDENDIYGYGSSDKAILQYDESADSWFSIFDLASRGLTGATKSYSVVVNPTAGTQTSNPGNAYVFYGFLYADDDVTYDSYAVVRQDVNSTMSISQPFELTGTDYFDASLFYDDNTETLYVFYMDINDDEIYYRTSDDWGDSWSSESRFDNTANSKAQSITPSSANKTGGQLYPIWVESSTIVTELDNVEALEGEPTEPVGAVEQNIAGWGDFLGTGFFVVIAAAGIFLAHLRFGIAYEFLYPFGLILGAILAHEDVGVLQPWWIIAAAALIGMLYFYRLVMAGSSSE